MRVAIISFGSQGEQRPCVALRPKRNNGYSHGTRSSYTWPPHHPATLWVTLIKAGMISATTSATISTRVSTVHAHMAVLAETVSVPAREAPPWLGHDARHQSSC